MIDTKNKKIVFTPSDEILQTFGESEEDIINESNNELNHLFFKELDVLVQEKYRILVDLVCDSCITSFNYQIKPSEKFLNKFGLNTDVSFEIVTTPGYGKTKYLYKNIELKPDNYYLRPTPYYEVTTLQIIQEAIKQDKYNPDIKYLERGENLIIK